MVHDRQMAADRHPADAHDLIKVHGARVNNLQDVAVEIPKRRLTVFRCFRVRKSSLVFGTIAAESQRMINETYSAFVQGFMPTLACADVDVLDGLTTAIIVDQERMGANACSTVGTVTDANAMLRILFSRLGQPHIGSPQAFSFNVASVSGAGAVTLERGGKQVKERRSFDHRRHVSDVRGNGYRVRLRPDRSVRRVEVAERGAVTIPGWSMDGWYGRLLARLRVLRSGQADSRLHGRGTRRLASSRADPDEDRRDQPHLPGPDPQSRSPFSQRTSRRFSRTSGRSWSAWSRSPPVRTAAEPGSTPPPAVDDRRVSIADACAWQISDLADWVRGLTSRPSRCCSRRCGTHWTPSLRSAWATCRWSAPPARCPAVRRSAPR